MPEYEYVSGDNYEILRRGNLSNGGCYCILNGGPKLILTVPKEIQKEHIEAVFKGVYAPYQWGIYYAKRIKRNVIPLSDLDQNKLETCVKKL